MGLNMLFIKPEQYPILYATHKDRNLHNHVLVCLIHSKHDCLRQIKHFTKFRDNSTIDAERGIYQFQLQKQIKFLEKYNKWICQIRHSKRMLYKLHGK